MYEYIETSYLNIYEEMLYSTIYEVLSIFIILTLFLTCFLKNVNFTLCREYMVTINICLYTHTHTSI